MSDMTNKIWRRKYLAFLHFITVICIMIGLVIHVGGWIGRDIWSSMFGKSYVSESKTTSGGSAPGAFTEIDADLAIGDITIKTGSDYDVSYDNYPEDLAPVIKYDNGTLKITQKNKRTGWSFNQNFTKGGEIVVTVPADAKLSLDMDLSMGAFEAKDITFDTVDIHASMGAIDLKNCTTYKLDLTADMGSITVDGGAFNYGNMDANMGSIDIDADFNDLEADCDMGSIDIKTSSDVSALRLALETDMGSITINGSDYGRTYKSR